MIAEEKAYQRNYSTRPEDFLLKSYNSASDIISSEISDVDPVNNEVTREYSKASYVTIYVESFNDNSPWANCMIRDSSGLLPVAIDKNSLIACQIEPGCTFEWLPTPSTIITLDRIRRHPRFLDDEKYESLLADCSAFDALLK